MNFWEMATPIVLGVFILLMGIFNTRGNTQTLHWYHRRRVSEEDRKPFGKLVGAGTILIGAAIILFGVMNYLSQKSGEEILVIIGSILLVAALIVGIGLNLYAMIKYNKGIF